MNYQLDSQPEFPILRLFEISNPLDNQQLINNLADKIDAGQTRWIIDLAQLKYINSTGLNLLISLLTRARSKGGEVVLIGLSANIKQVLILTRLQTLFVCKNELGEAVDFFHNLV